MSTKRAVGAAALAATISVSALTLSTGLAPGGPDGANAATLSELHRRSASRRRRTDPRAAGPAKPAAGPANARAAKPANQRAAEPTNQRAAKSTNQRAAQRPEQRAGDAAGQAEHRAGKPADERS